MTEPYILQFGPFRLDKSDERLWREADPLRLTAKAFAVLHYLVEHAGQLVTKDDLFQAVWTTSYGSEASLASCIRDIRRVLDDSVSAPQFVETVRGRGYRFVAPVTIESESPSRYDEALSKPQVQRVTELQPNATRSIVGRETELAQIHQWFDKALQGERQIGFVMGEAGIGKTTLVETVLSSLTSEASPWVGSGQCIQQYGAGEAYLPILEALSRLCRGPNGARLLTLLRQQAPSWLAQLPAQLSVLEREALYRQGNSASQERMLRELAEAVEELTVDHPLVLVLEDLHWCDPSTLEWLAYITRRRDPARLLVLATYRPVDAIIHDHPAHALIQELRVHSQCQVLALDYWSEVDVNEYVAQRYSDLQLPAGFVRLLHRRTSGNPLFVGAVVEEFIRQGILQSDATGREMIDEASSLAVEIPENLRQLIEQQVAQVSPAEQELLEVASVAGTEFSVAVVESVMAQPAPQIEAGYAALARRQQFVSAEGLETWPDGTVAARYRFIHALYQEVIYAQVSPGRRLMFHQQIGARKEIGYGLRAPEIAAELALHFVRGNDSQRAIRYLHLAGDNALWQSAHQEALVHLTEGLAHLQTLPETQERIEQEVGLQSALGLALQVTKGTTSPEVEQAYSRAHVLCQQLGETETLKLLQVLQGLWSFYANRTRLTTAKEIGIELLSRARRLQNSVYVLQAHVDLGNVALWMGDFPQALTHCQEGLTLYDAQDHHADAFVYGENPKVQTLVCLARTLWCLGYPEQSLLRIQQASTLAAESANAPSLAHALYHTTVIHRNRRDAEATAAQSQLLISTYPSPAFALWEPVGMVELGWAQVVQGLGPRGLQQMHEGLMALTALKADIFRPAFLLLLAEAYGLVGQSDKGLGALTEAHEVMASSEMYYMAAELSRLEGELLLQQAASNAAEAERCFHQALETARRQQAKSWELRTAISLSRLWQQQGKPDEAGTLLASVLNWFTEGFDTTDIQEAKALLIDLQKRSVSCTDNRAETA